MVWGCCHQSCVKGRRMRPIIGALFIVAFAACVGLTISKAIEETADPAKDKQLRLVHLVFRHGVRTPADTYPNDIHINQTFYPYGWGQLTNKGRNRQYATGQWIRKRYDDFFGKLYSTSTVYAQSTHPDRAHMSCAVTLAGMWPPKDTALEWNKELNWSPIPIRSEPLDEDTLLLARKNCPRYFEELENVFKLSEVEKIFNDNAELFKELTEKTGMEIKTPDDVQSLYNTLRAEVEYGLALPEWTEKYYPEKLIPLTETSFVLNAYNKELQRLKGGPLLKKLISDWTAKSKGALSPKERKLFVYTGHDSTISNLLLALGAWDQQVPDYGIMVMFELYENVKTNQFGVEFFLRNSTTSEPYQLRIPGCDQFCPLDKFVELTKDVVPANWSEDCKPKDPNYKPPAPTGP